MKRLHQFRRYHLLWVCLLVIVLLFGGMSYAQDVGGVVLGLEEQLRVGYNYSTIDSFVQFAETALKTIYLIFFPLLALTAAAMDNSLVYGGAFYLTPILFKFWQIMRTFCNYTIGLFFVGSILIAFFNNKSADIKKILPGILGAGIIINLSRWMVAALIDLSTIATVALGGLPLHALGGNDNIFKKNVYYMKVYTTINLTTSTQKNADSNDFSLIYGCTQNEQTTYYLPCGINDGKLYPNESVSEPISRQGRKANFLKVRENNTSMSGNNKVSNQTVTDNFCVLGKFLIGNEFGAEINDCKVTQDLMEKGKVEAMDKCATVDKILTKTVNNTGPLFTLFSSVLSMSELGLTPNTGSTKELALYSLVKLVFALAFFIPLVAFSVVMIVRVVYLRAIIVFSPLIVLLKAMSRNEAIKGKLDNLGTLKNIFSPSQVISLIFLPAIASFGISISIIFLSLLTHLPLMQKEIGAKTQEDGCYGDALTALGGVDRNQSDTDVIFDLGPVDVSLVKNLRDTGSNIGNILTRLVINFFGVALLWMIVFATLKTNEFTKDIAEKIDKTGQAFLKTVPLPFSGGVGVGALQQAPDMVQNYFKEKWGGEQSNILNEMTQSYAEETKEKQKAFTSGIKDPGSLSGINDNTIPPNTDFLSDYKMASEAYAKKAKNDYIVNGVLTPKGQAYARDNNISESDFSRSLQSLDTITSWEDAFKNKIFVDRLHTQDNGKGFDNFYKARDKRANKKNNTIQVIEEGLAAQSVGKNGKKIVTDTMKHRYLYDNDRKLTIFDRDANDKRFTGNVMTYTGLTKNTLSTLTKEDLTTHNQVLLAFNDSAIINTLPLYKLLTTQTADITVENKTYKKETNGSWTEKQ